MTAVQHLADPGAGGPVLATGRLRDGAPARKTFFEGIRRRTMAQPVLFSWCGGTGPIGAGGNDERDSAHDPLPHPAVARLADREQPGRTALPGVLRMRQGTGPIRHWQQHRPGWRLTRSCGHLCDEVVLRVAWTLVDLAGRTVPGSDEVAEALGVRHQRVAA